VEARLVPPLYLEQDPNQLIRSDGCISGNSHGNIGLESAQSKAVTYSDLKRPGR